MKTNQKLDHIVLLKVIAITLVVLAHATRSIHSPNAHMYTPIITPIWEILIKNYIYSFHMPLFFWISGYVFFYSSVEKGKKVSISAQLLDKVKSLIIPMYSTSLLILLPTIILLGHLNGSLLHQTKLLLLGGNNDHLWFLKCLFIIFLIAIPMKNIFNVNSKITMILIALAWMILYSLHLPLLGTAIKYFPFFLLGFYSRKFESAFNKLDFLTSFIALLLFHVVVLLLKKHFGVPASLTKPVWYFVAFLGIYYMYFLAKYLVSSTTSIVAWGMIKKIDETSYSIYLFHVTLLYLILYAVHFFGIQSPIIRVTVSFMTGMLLPILFHYMISGFKISSILFRISTKNQTTRHLQRIATSRAR